MKYTNKLAPGLAALFLTIAVPASVQANVNASPSFITPRLTTPSQAIQLARRRQPLSWHVGVRPSLYRVGGFSRSVSSCSNQTQITAFVPPPRSDEKIKPKDGAVDTTRSSHPTFWVHLAGVAPNTPMEFTLQAEAVGRNNLYSTRFQSNGQTGILGVRVPSTVPALKVGERYLWQIAIICDPNNRSGDRVLGSWVQRIDPAQLKPTAGFNPQPLVQALARASEQEQPALYAGLGIWQDAVTTLISLQLKQPQNQELKDDWRSLLTAAQMKEFINAPLIGVK